MSELLAVSRIEKAAAEALGCEPEDMKKESYDHYGLAIFSGNGMEIAIGDDEEADRAASDYIKESLWSFNPTFILSHSRVACSDKLQKAMVHLQKELCEEANPLVEALIKDLDHFVSDAISADGRGMFLSQYDNEEQEIDIDGVTYFYYRLN
jgi:hypothetical protein